MVNPNLPPYKVCPACGQPAVLEIQRCRRCGLAYPPAPAPAAPGYYRPSRPSAWPWVVAAAGGLMALLLVVGFAAARHAARAGASSSLTGTAGQILPHSDTGGTADLTGSLFHERPGAAENPTIHVTNLEDDLMTLTLRDAAGRQYVVRSINGITQTVSIPAGDYTVEVTSNDPMIHGSTGDATFRRYKEYDATFVHGPPMGPLHLGD